MLRRERFVIFC